VSPVVFDFLTYVGGLYAAVRVWRLLSDLLRGSL
jgi:hypothetical protein